MKQGHNIQIYFSNNLLIMNEDYNENFLFIAQNAINMMTEDVL